MWESRKRPQLFMVNRLRGSDFQCVVIEYQEICIKDAEIALCGRAKNMRQVPFCVRNMHMRTDFGLDLKLEDSLSAAVIDQHVQFPMRIISENFAAKHKTIREECNRYALLSQQR